MAEFALSQLSLRDQADWIERNGRMIIAQDYYSYFVVLYQLEDTTLRLVYDYSGSVLDIEEDLLPRKNHRDSRYLP